MFLRAVVMVPSIVQGVEALYGAKTGQQRRDAVVEMVGASIGLVDAVGNKTIVDSAKFTEALGVIVDGVVACLNASVWAKV